MLLLLIIPNTTYFAIYHYVCSEIYYISEIATYFVEPCSCFNSVVKKVLI